MNNSTTRYSREREREKKCDSFLKKSFSLVEAAIYLMLVGVLTTAVIGGAALVEKAKIQKVIEDIDYYEKAFMHFTVSYGAYPGNLDLNRCNKFDIFTCVLAKKGKWTKGDTIHGTGYPYNNTTEWTAPGSENGSGQFYHSSYMYQMTQLKSARLITTAENDMRALGGLTKFYYNNKQINFTANDIYYLSYDLNKKFGGKISYSKNGRASFNCLKFKNRKDGGNKGCRVWARGSYYWGKNVNTSKSEFYNTKNVPSENAIVFYYNQKASLDTNEGRGKGAVGLFSPKFVEKLDKKLDTGIPNKGRIIPIKVYNEVSEANVCYNTTTQKFRSTSNVKYIQTNKTKQGCNLGYVMKDYSGYIY